jgi:hypothetical protein
MKCCFLVPKTVSMEMEEHINGKRSQCVDLEMGAPQMRDVGLYVEDK